MVQLILLIIGFFYASKRGAINGLQSINFPHISFEDFRNWKRLELRSIDWFLLSTWGLVLIQIPWIVFIWFTRETSENVVKYIHGWIFLTINIGGFFAGLTISAAYGSKAARMRKDLGIHLGKETEAAKDQSQMDEGKIDARSGQDVSSAASALGRLTAHLGQMASWDEQAEELARQTVKTMVKANLSDEEILCSLRSLGIDKAAAIEFLTKVRET